MSHTAHGVVREPRTLRAARRADHNPQARHSSCLHYALSLARAKPRDYGSTRWAGEGAGGAEPGGGARRKGNALQSTNLDTKADANCQYGRHLEAEPMTQVVVLQRATDEQEFWHRLCFLIETKGPPEVPAAKGRLTPGAVRGGWPVWNDGLLRGGVPPIQHNTAGRRESHDVRTGTPPTPRPAVA